MNLGHTIREPSKLHALMIAHTRFLREWEKAPDNPDGTRDVEIDVAELERIRMDVTGRAVGNRTVYGVPEARAVFVGVLRHCAVELGCTLVEWIGDADEG